MSVDAVVFLRRFLAEPFRVGAVAPSSAALAREVLAPVPRTGEPVVVELGAGTGAFTRPLQERLGGRGHHVVLELDATFAELLRVRHPRADVVAGDAAELPDVLAARGLAAADIVVSGLPWAAFPADRCAAILTAVTSCLRADGEFTTFAYVHARRTPAARRLRCELRERFEDVVIGRTVWGNVPPALVYHARRPRR
jgi:phosphatidylethanolamine/phosphatidyl-N-methylethanolamine N-methyltransferase